MDNNIIFKSSAFGFDKKEVINYISELSQKNAENIAEINKLRTEIERYKQENEKLRADNEKLFDDNKSLVKSVDSDKEVIDSLKGRIAELEEKVSAFDDIEGAEEKANQLIMDSLKYSEACIKKAREVTTSMNVSTKNKIDRAKNCLNGVSDDFKLLSGKLQLSISEIADKLSDLSNGLDE